MEKPIYSKYLSKKRKKVISVFLATFSFLFLNLNNKLDAETNSPSSVDAKTFNEEINLFNSDIYLLGPGDTLKIVFYGAEEFNNNYEILNDGSLSLLSVFLNGLLFTSKFETSPNESDNLLSLIDLIVVLFPAPSILPKYFENFIC